MRLVCPNCDAKYEVSDDAIPEGGRDVQCANCGHAWFQLSEAGAAAVIGDDEAETVGAVPTADADIPEPAKAAYGVDDSVLAILREEADLESKARQAEARPLETQADLGVDGAPTVAQKRAAMLRGEPVEVAAAKPGARRDLLPDVEEINSTLKPSEQPFDPDAEVDALPNLNRSRSSFRSGFMMMLVLSGLGLITYLAAPQISAQIPGLTEPLNSYVSFVDMLRLQLDGLMRSATVAINGESGG